MIIVQPGDKLPALTAIPGDVSDWISAPMMPPPDSLRVARPHLGEALPTPQPDEAIIITGSAAMVTDHSEWIRAAEAWLRNALERGCYLLAICFGHQLLAQAMGGEVGDNPFGGEVGTVCSTLNAAGCRDRLLGVAAGVAPNDQQASLWVQTAHSQSVLRLPEQAELLASSALDPHHAYRIGERAWGIQFHPEFSAEVTAAFVRDAGDSVQQRGETTAGLLAGIRDSEAGPRLLARFADIARASPLTQDISNEQA
jgi:GMP synthase (glutamine-hydrolysing)